MFVVLKTGWCDGEGSEMVLMLQGKKTTTNKCFSWFLCTERQQTGLQKYPKLFSTGGLCPLGPPAGHCRCTLLGPSWPLDPQRGIAPAPYWGLVMGHCPCTLRGPSWPLDPVHFGSELPKHFFQFPCLMLATRLGMTVLRHKPECPVEKFDYCVQGQGHSEGLKDQWMFVQMISSETWNILLPNLLWWCSIISQSVLWQKLNYCNKSEGHSKRVKMPMFVQNISSEPTNILLPN